MQLCDCITYSCFQNDNFHAERRELLSGCQSSDASTNNQHLALLAHYSQTVTIKLRVLQKHTLCMLPSILGNYSN